MGKWDNTLIVTKNNKIGDWNFELIQEWDNTAVTWAGFWYSASLVLHAIIVCLQDHQETKLGPR